MSRTEGSARKGRPFCCLAHRIARMPWSCRDHHPDSARHRHVKDRLFLTSVQTVPLKIGLFDIMQIDPLSGFEIPTMFAERLADLSYADDLGFDVAFTAERHFMPQFAASSAT